MINTTSFKLSNHPTPRLSTVRLLVYSMTISVLSACSGYPSPMKEAFSPAMDLSAKRYEVFDISEFGTAQTRCGDYRLLQCLNSTELTCRLVYRAANVECVLQLADDVGGTPDVGSSENEEILNRCVAQRIIQYGKRYFEQEPQCYSLYPEFNLE